MLSYFMSTISYIFTLSGLILDIYGAFILVKGLLLGNSYLIKNLGTPDREELGLIPFYALKLITPKKFDPDLHGGGTATSAYKDAFYGIFFLVLGFIFQIIGATLSFLA